MVNYLYYNILGAASHVSNTSDDSAEEDDCIEPCRQGIIMEYYKKAAQCMHKDQDIIQYSVTQMDVFYVPVACIATGTILVWMQIAYKNFGC